MVYCPLVSTWTVCVDINRISFLAASVPNKILVFLSVSRLRAGIPSRYVISQLGQLSLASLRGRLIEYQLRLG